MSQNVARTRTTTTNSTTASIAITGHILMVAQLVLGIFVVGIFCYYTNNYLRYTAFSLTKLAFLTIPAAFLIGNICFLFASLLSIKAGGVIFRTILDVVYHSVAVISYLPVSIAFFSEVVRTIPSSATVYNGYLTSAIFGIIASGLYFISAFLTCRFYRNIIY
ncbi:hypothetical protein DMENIID0001_034760 [Sergentomyia squamirostris]